MAIVVATALSPGGRADAGALVTHPVDPDPGPGLTQAAPPASLEGAAGAGARADVAPLGTWLSKPGGERRTARTGSGPAPWAGFGNSWAPSAESATADRIARRLASIATPPSDGGAGGFRSPFSLRPSGEGVTDAGKPAVSSAPSARTAGSSEFAPPVGPAAQPLGEAPAPAGRSGGSFAGLTRPADTGQTGTTDPAVQPATAIGGTGVTGAGSTAASASPSAFASASASPSASASGVAVAAQTLGSPVSTPSTGGTSGAAGSAGTAASAPATAQTATGATATASSQTAVSQQGPGATATASVASPQGSGATATASPAPATPQAAAPAAGTATAQAPAGAPGVGAANGQATAPTPAAPSSTANPPGTSSGSPATATPGPNPAGTLGPAPTLTPLPAAPPAAAAQLASAAALTTSVPTAPVTPGSVINQALNAAVLNQVLGTPSGNGTATPPASPSGTGEGGGSGSNTGTGPNTGVVGLPQKADPLGAVSGIPSTAVPPDSVVTTANGKLVPPPTPASATPPAGLPVPTAQVTNPIRVETGRDALAAAGDSPLPAPVPEPSPLALVGLLVAAFAARRVRSQPAGGKAAASTA